MKVIKADALPKDFFSQRTVVVTESVRKILQDVKDQGDEAIRSCTKEFDKIDLLSFEVREEEKQTALSGLDDKTRQALKFAAKTIENFACFQMEQNKRFELRKNGIITGQKVIPLKRVGCYVPGGRYPLPSTALMTVIPAKVAGVKEIIVCSPNIKPITIAAAVMAGAERIFRIGGVQAIGAMAFGTQTVPQVDKIVGPGNTFVTQAKKEVFGLVGIDMLAGPSEVLIVADKSANPQFIAADMLAQAEHDPEAQAILLTDSEELARAVLREAKRQLADIPTKDITKQSIEHAIVIIVQAIEEAVELVNRKAPEHLELQGKKAEALASQFQNFGSLFIGSYTAEVFGDYCSGPNHTLPTNRTSRFSGGLSVRDFVKIVTYQKMSKEGAGSIAQTAAVLASNEGLIAHQRSALMRTKK